MGRRSAKLAARGLMTPIGTTAPIYDSVVPKGWLVSYGTIGSVASGATETGNQVFRLYEHIWEKFDNTEAEILDSSGSATSRGASALADFNDNKRMPLPDCRSEFIRGSDLGRGVDPGRLIGNFQAGMNAAHTHDVSGTSNTTGAHYHGTNSNGGIDAGTPNSIQYFALANNNLGVIAQGTGLQGGNHSHTITGTAAAAGGTEARPRNINMPFMIKA